ncbi:BUD13 [Chionoecetes opilio]|uniref:BUD13 homolog n=1 Tax=Chionoecetes opilio TaxID=41210 RepID=A0A8J4YCL7_CHIOP|nr:BUD13 [Chionoecetes opilio]
MAAGGALSQKEYLKKYLSGAEAEKKKKKKKKKDKVSSHNKGMRIIEDSLDLKTVPYGYKDEDDKPTIAEVTYDDDKLKIMEEFEANKKWKKMLDRSSECQDENDSPRKACHHSPSPPRRAKNDAATQRKVRHDSESLTPPRRKKNDSSPPRRVRHDSTSDSDDSPPRKTKYKHDSDSSSDSGGRHDSESPPRRPNFESSKGNASPRRVRHESDSPRGPRHDSHDSHTPPWKPQLKSNTPPLDKKTDALKRTKTYVSPNVRNPSPPARLRKDSDSSLSDDGKNSISIPLDIPQRQRRRDSSSSSPPPRRKRLDSDTARKHDIDTSSNKRLSSSVVSKRNKQSNSHGQDYSDSSHSDSDSVDSQDSPSYTPPLRNLKKEAKFVPSKRKQEVRTAGGRAADLGPHTSPKRKAQEADASPPRRKRHDSDSSPPRKKKLTSDSNPQKRYDSDTSPPRQKRRDNDSSPPRKKRLTDSSPRQKRYDSDASPPRQKRHDSDSSPVRRKRQSDSDPSPPRLKRGKAFVSPPRRKGEGQAGQGEGMLRQERKMTTQEFLTARKHGRLKKDTPEELARKERESVLQQQAEEKHQQWKHGVKQVQDYKKKIASDMHEMGKSLTRTADDVDMNTHLKMVSRREDPMLEYITKKDTKTDKGAVKPVYKGSFPPNRLDIRPGYRWDGVDRSCGFEKRWFEHQNNKRAHNEDAYKWSVSDM